MKDELFQELLESVREDGAILRGEETPARKTEVAAMEEMQERTRFLVALKEGIEDLEAGNAKPAEEVFEELRVKYGL